RSPHPTPLTMRSKCLALAVEEALHHALRLASQERLAELADAEIDGLGERQFLPMAAQLFLGAQRVGAAFQQRLHGVLDGLVEAAWWSDVIDQAPGERGR